MRHGLVFQAFYERQVAAGKPKLIAWVAAMRKLPMVRQAIAKGDPHWDDSVHSVWLGSSLFKC